MVDAIENLCFKSIKENRQCNLYSVEVLHLGPKPNSLRELEQEHQLLHASKSTSGLFKWTRNRRDVNDQIRAMDYAATCLNGIG